MAAPAQALHNVTDVLGTAIDPVTGLVTAQTGDNLAGAGTNAGQVYSQGVEMWQHVGFCSRPAPPVAGSAAAQVVCITRSDQDIAVASRDPRGAALYGNLKDGEACIYAPVGQARVLCKADGSVTMLTTSDNTAGGSTVSFRFDANGITGIWPWGSVSFTKQNGLVVQHQSGAAMALGPVQGIPAPLNAISSAFSVSAGICQIEGSTVMLGAGSAFAACAINATGTAPITPVPGSSTVFVSV